uniref:Uncharacterized protein n=1 Tax=Rhizophora mucronata TaxID=61149 RepID=A0A2P2K7G9_RHIMU
MMFLSLNISPEHPQFFTVFLSFCCCLLSTYNTPTYRAKEPAKCQPISSYHSGSRLNSTP